MKGRAGHEQRARAAVGLVGAGREQRAGVAGSATAGHKPRAGVAGLAGAGHELRVSPAGLARAGYKPRAGVAGLAGAGHEQRTRAAVGLVGAGPELRAGVAGSENCGHEQSARASVGLARARRELRAGVTGSARAGDEQCARMAPGVTRHFARLRSAGRPGPLTAGRRAVTYAACLDIFVALGLALMVSSCRHLSWPEALEWPGKAGERADTISGTGYLEARQVRLASLFAGTVVQVAVAESDRVRPGDELVVISSPAIEGERQAAQVALERAEARLAALRSGGLAAGPASPTQLRLAEAECEQARAAWRLAEAKANRLVIRAPVEATIGAVLTAVGDQVLPGQPLVRLCRLQELSLVIYVPQSQVGKLTIGQSAELSLPGEPEEVYDARVTGIASEPEFTPRNVQTDEDRAGLVYAVRLAVVDQEAALRPGMPARAEIEVAAP